MTRPTRDIEALSAAAAEAERAAVLAELDDIGEDADDLRFRAGRDGLTGWEMAVLTELDALEDRLSA